MVAIGCLIPENLLGASKFLRVKSLVKSTPHIVAVGSVLIGLALLLAAVSNGTTGVTALAR